MIVDKPEWGTNDKHTSLSDDPVRGFTCNRWFPIENTGRRRHFS